MVSPVGVASSESRQLSSWSMGSCVPPGPQMGTSFLCRRRWGAIVLEPWLMEGGGGGGGEDLIHYVCI